LILSSFLLLGACLGVDVGGAKEEGSGLSIPGSKIFSSQKYNSYTATDFDGRFLKTFLPVQL
jgi:hypothetical protein